LTTTARAKLGGGNPAQDAFGLYTQTKAVRNFEPYAGQLEDPPEHELGPLRAEPPHPGWSLILDTRGVLPVFGRDKARLSELTDPRSNSSTELFTPRYGFIRWERAPDSEKLVAVECLSTRNWVKQLKRGHGVVSHETLDVFENFVTEMGVRVMNLGDVPVAASWPAEIMEAINKW
jgi:hypothetical protein